MQFQIFHKITCALESLPEKTGHDGNNDTYNYHGGNREINFQVRPVNDNITRQTPYGKFSEPWPEKPHRQKYQTQDDQRFLHYTLFTFEQKKLNLALGQFLQQAFYHIAVCKFTEMLHNGRHGLHWTLVLR